MAKQKASSEKLAKDEEVQDTDISDIDLPEVRANKEVVVPNTGDMDIEADDVSAEGSIRDHFFHPAIICGYCEWCGTTKYVGGEVRVTIDKHFNVPAHSLTGGKWVEIPACECPHYKRLYDKGQRIRCSYCNESFTGLKNTLGKFMEILATRIVYVMSFASEPKKLIMYCDSFECREKHIKRMKNQ